MYKLFTLFIAILFAGACFSTPDINQRRPVDVAKTFQGISSCEHTATTFNCVNLVDVYDGDTIFVDIPGNHQLFGKRIGVRIFGIDTPEIRSLDLCEKDKGQEAKFALESFLRNATRVDIVNVQRDKYFRILGTVLADGNSAGDELIRRNLAYPYHGEAKPKRDWCR